MKRKKIAWFKAERDRLAIEQKIDVRDSDFRILERGTQINLLDQIIDKDEMEVAK